MMDKQLRTVDDHIFVLVCTSELRNGIYLGSYLSVIKVQRILI